MTFPELTAGPFKDWSEAKLAHALSKLLTNKLAEYDGRAQTPRWRVRDWTRLKDQLQRAERVEMLLQVKP